MPTKSSAYLTDNTKYHNFNFSEIERVLAPLFYSSLDEMHLDAWCDEEKCNIGTSRRKILYHNCYKKI